MTARWAPTADAGYFAARALDVFGPHHPLVGAYSSASFGTTNLVNNLGPTQFVLLSPFARLDPIAGVGLGTALINVAAVFTTWWASKRTLGPRGTALVMVATVAIELSVGGQALIDPRQQVALVLPFWALLWLSVMLVCGHSQALAPWVLFGSLIVQTHFTYLFLGAGLSIIALVGLGRILREGGTRRTARWHLIYAAGASLILWAPTFIDQMQGTGNLGRALTLDAAGSVSPGTAIGLFAAGPFGRAIWPPGSVEKFSNDPVAPLSLSLAVLLGWILAATAVGITAFRSSRLRDRALALVCASVLFAVFASAYLITPTAYEGIRPPNYLWMWPAAYFVGIAAIVCLSNTTATTTIGSVATSHRIVFAALTVALTVNPDALRVSRFTDVPAVRTEGWGYSYLAEIDRRLSALTSDQLVELRSQPVIVTAVRDGFWSDQYGLLAILTAHGIDFSFNPCNASTPQYDVARFGSGRCSDGTEQWEVRTAATGPNDNSNYITLSSGGHIGRSTIAAMQTRRRDIAALIAAGFVRVDAAALREMARDPRALVSDLASDSPKIGRDAAADLVWWSSRGAVWVDERYREVFASWRSDEFQLGVVDQFVYLAPIGDLEGALTRNPLSRSDTQ